MTEQQAKILLERYYSNQLDWDEERIVTKWMDSLAADEIAINAEEQLEIKNRISQKIYEQTGVFPDKETGPTALFNQNNSNYLNRIKKWVVAATLALVVGGSIYFYHHHKIKSNPSELVHAEINDLSPGGNCATLTLADGKQIVLDSNTNEGIGNLENMGIRKLGNGQIAFIQTGSTHKNLKREMRFNTLEVPTGGQYQLTLTDGSRVWLNAASKLKFPEVFIGDSRKVTLEGEAYFEIKHNAAPPFLVQAEGQLIEVLGTEFNVNAYSNEEDIETTLVKGKAKLGSIILKPGEQAVSKTNGKISLKKGVDIEEVISWKNGDFSFQSATMPEIMRQVERWYKADVIFEGTIEGTFSGGISRNVKLSQLLQILELTHKVKFTLIGNKLIVKPIKSLPM